MKMSKRLLIFSAILAAALITPLRLSAQDSDMTAERAKAEPEEKEKPLDVGEFSKPANLWPKGDYVIINATHAKKGHGFHIGPTGLWGYAYGQNILVGKVDPGSPADGKILEGDVIYGVNSKGFPAMPNAQYERDVRYHFVNAITKAETKEAGGKMVLDIRRDGKLIKVPIQLKVMGSFSSTTPWNCEKSKNIVAGAEEYMRKGLRPETGLPNNGKYMYGPWNDSVLFLLATGNPEMLGLARRYIRRTTDALDAWKAWSQERGKSFNSYSGWGFAYIKMLYGEYYHLTGDRTVLPYLEGLSNGTFKRGPNPNKPEVKPGPAPRQDWSWPPRPSGYGTHPNPQIVSTIGELLANEAGLKVNKDKIRFNLRHLHYKRAEHGWVKYCGYGAQPIERRQSAAPLEITAEQKATGTYSAMNGKIGVAAALFSLVGPKTTVDTCAIRCVYTFNRTHRGHGGVWFNGFWTPIGASHAGQKKFTHFMKGQQWWRELYRDHTGSMWQTGNAKEKKSVLSTGFAIHRTIPRKKLRMFGAPRSMFAPTAPAYIKGALAAHRSRGYARAEQLTRKLLTDGSVPAKDKERVNHFLNSVKTLKESIEYDLTFTEKLIAKGNYALADVEASQLKMVVSPSNARMKAIAKTLESPKAKAHIAAAMAQAKQNQIAAIKATGGSKEARKAAFQREVATLVPLIKDGVKYAAVGLRRGTFWPTYSKAELTPWRIQTVKAVKGAPDGWEQPGFAGGNWKAATLPAKWRTNHAGLLKTNFEVRDPNALKSLRVRMAARGLRDMTIYLNGEIVAKGESFPGGLVFDLKPGSLKLLKKGQNALAVSTQRGYGSHGLGLRLEGIPKNPVLQEVDLPKQKKRNKKQPKPKKEKKKKKKK